MWGGSDRAAGGRESALGLPRRGAGACLAGAAAAQPSRAKVVGLTLT